MTVPTPAETAEMQAKVAALDDWDLARELSFAEGFGPEADDNAAAWIGLLRAEHTRRKPLTDTELRAMPVPNPPVGFKRIMVLDDGVTYSGLDGCSILAVPADFDGDDIDDLLNGRHPDFPVEPGERIVPADMVVTVFQDPA